ncbi:hypothetical protein AVEN_167126-1 [Araneus ventricosus]|uniref:Uncharacterized protein n=1 Tax=Araneus ventricosus TaxID=182803 RepID=A0A4Y2LMM0_ARAVE|nr:hypothetical protein AVEN_167126-1 [Araneus ventricosus]
MENNNSSHSPEDSPVAKRLKTDDGRSGLVVTSQPRDQRLGSKPNSTKPPPCKRVWCMLNPLGPNMLLLVWCGSLERGANSGVVLVI